MSENESDFKVSKVADAEDVTETKVLPNDELPGIPDDENDDLSIETESELAHESEFEAAPVKESTAKNADTVSQEEIEPFKVVGDGIYELNERVAALEKLFQAKILHTEHEEKIVDQMHKELQRYKEDMYSRLVRPILLDIITMRDSILNVVAAYREKSEEDWFVPLATIEISADEAQMILEKNGIDVYKSDEGSEFIPVRQKAIKKIITDDQNLHGKVVKSLSDGYNYNQKTISPEKVIVYFYEKSSSAQAENKEEETHNG